MEYKEKILNFLKENNIKFGKVEQEGNNESIVVHMDTDMNDKMFEIQDRLQDEFDVVVMQSDFYSMNVFIIESNNLE